MRNFMDYRFDRILRFVGLMAVFTVGLGAVLAAQTAEPRRYAIVIGINQYDDQGILAL
jgi:hypothetical protein